MKFYFWPNNKKPDWIANFKQEDLATITLWAVAAWLIVLSLKFMWWAWIIALVVYLTRKRK